MLPRSVGGCHSELSTRPAATSARAAFTASQPASLANSASDNSTLPITINFAAELAEAKQKTDAGAKSVIQPLLLVFFENRKTSETFAAGNSFW